MSRLDAVAAGVCGLAVESAWLAARLAMYPVGLLTEQLADDGLAAIGYRTDLLPPARRSLLVTDLAAANTPVLLLHGVLDNRSAFTVFRRALHRRGIGVVHAMNYSPFTDDIRVAAAELDTQVQALRALTGSDKVHIVGHSLGGIIARYYVQRLGGHACVDTLATLGSPHAGSALARLLPTALGRQLRPGSALITELAEPAPGCTTRFLAVWSRIDELVIPVRNALLIHPDLDVVGLELGDVGHLSLALDRRVAHAVVANILRSGHAPVRTGTDHGSPAGGSTTQRELAAPAS